MSDSLRTTRRSAKHHARSTVSTQDCDATTLYTYPTKSSTIDASVGPVTFTWSTTCLDASTIDLSLRSPSLASPLIKVFQNIPYSSGSYSVQLLPKWWNSTTSINLQAAITISDSPYASFVNSVPQGYQFEVTYPADLLVTTVSGGRVTAAAAANTASPDPVVVSLNSKSSSMSVAKIFSAAFFPVLAIVALVAGFLFYTRRKQADKRKRWSSAVDKRMSTISESWQSPTGASPRKSQGGGGDRRTMMSVASHNAAGFGVWRGEAPSMGEPQMAESTPRFSTHTDARPRVSFFEANRGSFTDDSSRKSVVSLPTTESKGGMKTSKSLPHGLLGKLAANSPPRDKKAPPMPKSTLLTRKAVSHGKASWSVSGMEASAMTGDGKGRDLISLSPDQAQGPWNVEQPLEPEQEEEKEEQEHMIETVGRLRQSFRYPVGDARHSVAEALAEHYNLDLTDERTLSMYSTQSSAAPEFAPSPVSAHFPTNTIGQGSLMGNPDEMMQAYAVRKNSTAN